MKSNSDYHFYWVIFSFNLKISSWGQSSSIVGKMLALHIANPCSTSSILYASFMNYQEGFRSFAEPEISPEQHKARPQTKDNNNNKREFELFLFSINLQCNVGWYFLFYILEGITSSSCPPSLIGLSWLLNGLLLRLSCAGNHQCHPVVPQATM